MEMVEVAGRPRFSRIEHFKLGQEEPPMVVLDGLQRRGGPVLPYGLTLVLDVEGASIGVAIDTASEVVSTSGGGESSCEPYRYACRRCGSVQLRRRTRAGGYRCHRCGETMPADARIDLKADR